MALKSQRQLLSPWERSGEDFRPRAENKETPGPLNRKRSRKGSWGQRRQALLTRGDSQSFCQMLQVAWEGGSAHA